MIFVTIENVWIITREREPSNAVLQEAYGVLDKYNINRSTFSKTIQQKCDDDDDGDGESNGNTDNDGQGGERNYNAQNNHTNFESSES